MVFKIPALSSSFLGLPLALRLLAEAADELRERDLDFERDLDLDFDLDLDLDFDLDLDLDFDFDFLPSSSLPLAK